MRLMLFEAAHRRVRAQLAPWSGQLELLIVDREGRITHDGMSVTPEAAQPDVAWMSADGMMGGAARGMIAALMAARKPAWVHSGAAGVDNPIWSQLTAKGVLLTTGHGQAISIAEYVMGEVLAHFQRHGERRARQAAHAWTRIPFREIGRMRWLIVGFGAIGQAVAERAKGFGAHVTGVRRSIGDHPLADGTGALADLHRLLPDADVVVLAAPLNDATRGFANADFFAAMKPGSMLVNVGRGDLVDEAALLAALERGAPEHAALDVFHDEPLPAESPFWDHPRVSVNPHASAFGDGQAARNDAIFIENLRRRLGGEPLLHEADSRDLG